ncbi:MAG: hypothetical protein FJ293_01500 [Planctomycetes bacterium]|nr:hypothetical protein [Planctomycetota bacterium]
MSGSGLDWGRHSGRTFPPGAGSRVAFPLSPPESPLFLLRLLLVLLYPAAVAWTVWRRPRQAAAAARALGCSIEGAWFVRSPRTPRLLVWIAGALIVSFLPRFGLPLAFALALLTAPIAAAGTVRLLAVCGAGVLLDGTLLRFDRFSGFTVQRELGLLSLLRSDGAPPRELRVGRLLLDTVAAALSRHLPQITPAG